MNGAKNDKVDSSCVFVHPRMVEGERTASRNKINRSTV